MEHPQGKMLVRTEIVDRNGEVTVKQASQIRTARKLFEGEGVRASVGLVEATLGGVLSTLRLQTVKSPGRLQET